MRLLSRAVVLAISLGLIAPSAFAQRPREIDPTTGPDPFRPKEAEGPSWLDAPPSAAGTELLPRGAPSNPAPVATGDSQAALRKLEARVAELEEESARRNRRLEWLEHVKLEGLVQAQLLWQSFNSSGSPNVDPETDRLPAGISPNATIAQRDGTTSNTDAFRLRRARLRTELSPSEYAKLVVELDPSMVAANGVGTTFIARNVEADLIVPWSRDVQTKFGMGIFRVPFGYEMLQADHTTGFIERSWMQNNLFPGEYDTGLHAYTTALRRRLTIQAAVVNGISLAEKTFSLLPDLNRGKDVVGRINYNFGPFDVGLSGDYGQGQQVDAAALRFKQFPRWGVNVEAAVHHVWIREMGATRIYGELALAHNLDRGLHYTFAPPAIPADVNASVEDRDERGLFVRLEQDVTRFATVGFRYDMYTPDSAQKNNARDTYSFLGAINFTRGLRLLLEFDQVIDNGHRPGTQAPSRRIQNFSSALQARF
jgi:hypothetical protein